ncbi:MAG: hypothetical protein ACREQ5_03970 [Candidatus Dormibacteria bacterium]
MNPIEYAALVFIFLVMWGVGWAIRQYLNFRAGREPFGADLQWAQELAAFHAALGKEFHYEVEEIAA